MGRNITILTFSGRENGNCAAVREFIKQYYADETQTNVFNFAINNTNFSNCGNCDYECLKPGQVCPGLDDTQREIMDALCGSDLIYFVVPNFCGYPCGNYFAFNERSVGYFSMDRGKKAKYLAIPKRFIMISNSANDQFVNAMRQQVNGEPEMLYLMTGKYQKRSIAGDLLTSQEAQSDLKAFLDADKSCRLCL